MRKLRLGIDLDGVCYNFVDEAREWLVLQGHPRAQLVQATCWDFFKDQWGITTKDFIAEMNRAVDARAMWVVGHARLDCVSALHSLHNFGHELHVVTHREWGGPGMAEANTRWWLHENNLGHLLSSLTFSADKTSVPVDLFLDDATHNCEAIEAAGGTAVVFDQAWNQDCKSKLRVRSWREFVTLVNSLALAPGPPSVIDGREVRLGRDLAAAWERSPYRVSSYRAASYRGRFNG